MSQTQMKNRCPDSKLFGVGALRNYQLNFLEFSPRWQGGCADVVPTENAEVWGLVYEVSENDISNLDQFEGHPEFYRRSVVDVHLDNEKVLKAVLYVLVNKKPFIAPTKEYLNIIKTAAINFNFPLSYRAYLNSIPFIP